MKIILIGNYAPDHQESMERFTAMLHKGFMSSGLNVEIWKPKVLFGKFFKSTGSGIPKWFGYIDKWLLFPLILIIKSKKNIYNDNVVKYHICDHSNAPYLQFLPRHKVLITCHDVLAIKGALGHTDAYCPATPMGKLLQKWILNNLKKSLKLAAVSNYTLDQLITLTSIPNHPHKWQVIHNALNAPFKKMEPNKAKNLLLKMNLNVDEPFILHVGSGLPRKNRKALLQIIDYLEHKWVGNVCFAGKPLEQELINYAKELNLTNRIINIIQPDHQQLVALYSTCEAFIFPSFSEGFGWPVIEAQACGAPVIASSFDPMPEVSGGSAIHKNPNDFQGLGDALYSLKNIDYRKEVINNGFINVKRFQLDQMINSYIKLHQSTI